MEIEATAKKRVRIVLPAHNEARSLTGSVLQLRQFCESRLNDFHWHLLIVDNGSTDRTARVANELSRDLERVSAIHLPQAGRGGALVRATSDEDFDYLVYTDVDLSADINAIPKLLAALEGGADLAVGTRLHPLSQVRRRLYREVLSRGYNLLLRASLGIRRFRDAQCGLKAWNRKKVQPLIEGIQDRRWFFDTELLVLAERRGLGIVEIPVDWTEDTDSSVRIPRTIYEKIRGVLRLRKSARPDDT